MRILITSAYPVNGETGSAVIAKTLALELSKKHKVMYLCLGKKWTKQTINKNLSYLKIPSTNINDIWVPTTTPMVINKITQELDKFAPNIVHAQNIIFGGLIALIWSLERNVPYVITFHSIPSEGVGYVFPKIQNDKIISTINFQLTSNYIRNFLKHVDLIIALNKAIVKSLKSMMIETPFKLINNGLDLNKFFKLKANAPSETVNFIFPGSYISRKNQEYLIKSFSHLPKNFVLSLFGNKISGVFYAKKLEKLISKNNQENVKLNGFLTQQKLLLEYQKSHYFVSASLKEVQSIVYIEAIASGKLVISLENETTKDLINDKNGLVVKKSATPKQFAIKLENYVNTLNKNYTKHSQDARETVKNFDIRIVSNLLTGAYREIINKKTIAPKANETAVYQAIKEVIPEPIEKLIPDFVKYKGKKTHMLNLKVLLHISSALTLLIGGVGVILSGFKKFNQKIKPG